MATTISKLTSEALAALIELAGRWEEIEQQILDVQEEMQQADIVISGRVTAVEAKNTAQDGSLSSLASSISGVSTNLGLVTTSLNQSIARIVALEQAVALLGGGGGGSFDPTAIIAQITAIQEQVDQALEDIADLQAQTVSPIASGLIMTSPNGTKYKYTAANEGNILFQLDNT